MNNDFFRWGSELETGIKMIDDDHKGLIDTINEILQHCFSSETIQEYDIRSIYEKLSTYVNQHFDSEEGLMGKYGIDVRHQNLHLNAHLNFKSDVAAYFADCSQLVQPLKLSEVAEFLVRWLSYHILSVDKSLVRQIQSIESTDISPAEAYEIEQTQNQNSTEPLLKALKELFFVISEKNRELVKLNSELEEKVAQRTINLQKAYDQLEYVTMRDELTGLYNRRYAIASLDLSIAEWQRYHTVFSVLFIDVDKFKAVNDQYGHEYGDKVLIWLAKYLSNNTRKTDIVCRLGGDEFLIICNHLHANEAFQLANKLTTNYQNIVNDEIYQFWTPSLSIGVVQIDERCQSGSDLLKISDSAMYTAKKSGGNSSNLVRP